MNYCRFRNDFIKRMANAGGGLLPAEYQQVEYLQSTGRNWIDTGINVTTSLKTICEFAVVTGFSFSNATYIFGAYTDSGGVTRYSVAIPSATQLRLPGATAFANYTIPSISINQAYTLSYRFGETTFSGDVISNVSSNVGTTPKTLWLFGRNYNGSELTANLRIYTVQLGTVDNEILYRNLIPCYRKSDNVTGMYDLTTSAFIPYSGSENFITGNNV